MWPPGNSCAGKSILHSNKSTENKMFSVLFYIRFNCGSLRCFRLSLGEEQAQQRKERAAEGE